MNNTVREWREKADGDFASAGRELRARKLPNYDAACFHAQQCIEKLAKAVLVHTGTRFPKTHDLAVLYRLLPNAPLFAVREEDLRFLSRAAVAMRYPGESASHDDAKKAYAICRELRDALLVCLDRWAPRRQR
jgi:HEPN domain-containing protein